MVKGIGCIEGSGLIKYVVCEAQRSESPTGQRVATEGAGALRDLYHGQQVQI